MNNVFGEDIGASEKYYKSEANFEVCKPYFDICAETLLMVNSYAERVRTAPNVHFVKREFARGGQLLHRGFYFPSLFLDLTIGNANRGRLLKRVGSKLPDYIYYFDQENRLVLAEKYENNRLLTTEKIFYDGEDEYGVTVHAGWEEKITYFTKCHFENGKKISYLFALIGCDGGKNDTVTDLSFETYQYEDGLFAAADYYSFFPSIPLLNHCKYRFDRDENEYLHTYRVKKYEGETLKSGFWDEHMFTISKSKRRR